MLLTPRLQQPAQRGWVRCLGLLLLLGTVKPGVALAQRNSTQEALVRLEETLVAREQDGVLALKALTPILVASTAPAFEETRAWYPNAALAALLRVFGSNALRSCEACMAPRVHVQDGRLEQHVAALTIEDIVRLDDAARGTAPSARTAIWLDESPDGVSLRVIELGTSRVLYANNFDARLSELTRTQKNFTRTRELERRLRGDSLSHVFIDAALYPGQHLSMDWTEQWGDDNLNLSGLSISAFDPVLGVGAAYYRVIPELLNISVGAQGLLSLPTALVAATTGDAGQQAIDPLLTGVLVVRLPIASSNYGVFLMGSTNLRVGIGISLMNISFLPVLP